MSYFDYLEWRFKNLNEALSFLLAILSLAVAYIGPKFFANGFLIGVVIPIVTATIAVVPHELAHRQTARNYGCVSRFVLSFKGFIVTLIINLLSGVFGLGYLVFVSGYTSSLCRFGGLTKDIEGKISVAGPLTNLAIGIVSFILLLVVPIQNITLEYLLAELFSFNTYVAFFNLIPFPPLDGQKVIRWNPILWGVLIIVSFFLSFFPYYFI